MAPSDRQTEQQRLAELALRHRAEETRTLNAADVLYNTPNKENALEFEVSALRERAGLDRTKDESREEMAKAYLYNTTKENESARRWAPDAPWLEQPCKTLVYFLPAGFEGGEFRGRCRRFRKQ